MLNKLGFHKYAASTSYGPDMKPIAFTRAPMKNSAAIKAETLLGKIQKLLKAKGK